MTFRGKGLFFGLALGLFAVDLATKYAAFAAVANHGRPSALHGGDRAVEVVPGFFYLVEAYNPGGMWSIAQTGPLSKLLVIFRAIAVPALVWMAATTPAKQRVALAAFGLFCAGALGNLYDNLVFSGRGVRDFLDFFLVGANGYHYPTFNVADASIVSAAILLAYDLLLRKKPSEGAAEKAPEAKPLR